MSQRQQDEEKAKQEMALTVAKEAGRYALTKASDVTSLVHDYIKRGPQGVGWLCFVGGTTSFIFGFLGLFNVFSIILDPLVYLINIYQMGMGLMTCILEAPEEWVQKHERLEHAQKFVHDYMKFLTTFGGRGLFYLFQGSLAMSMTGVGMMALLLGLYMMGMGFLCVGMQYGYHPDLTFMQPAPDTVGDDYIQIKDARGR